MEVIRGTFHTVFPMEDASRVGEARRFAAQLAAQVDMDAVAAGRLALVVTELGTNLVRHATNGRLLLAARPGQVEVEVLSIDEGPGIADIGRSMGDGFSTGGTPGTGLGAVRRLAHDFDMHSAVPGGTVVVARVRASELGAPRRRVQRAAALSMCAPGEQVCGDGWAFALDETHAALMVADGLGHGPAAAEASEAALRTFVANPMAHPREMLEATHRGLRGTRGAAVMTLQADAAAGAIRSAGAGNVMARLVSGISDRTILTQHGTAGVAVRSVEETRTPWPEHALLVVFSDGIESRWPPELLAPVLGNDPSLAAALLVRDHCRGRDDATVAVLRRKD